MIEHWLRLAIWKTLPKVQKMSFADPEMKKKANSSIEREHLAVADRRQEARERLIRVAQELSRKSYAQEAAATSSMSVKRGRRNEIVAGK